MTLQRHACRNLALTLALLMVPAGLAHAQAIDTNGLAAGTDPSREVNIESDSMEVRDQEGIAIFTGNVDARRAGTHLTSARMVVHYAKLPGTGSTAAASSTVGQGSGSTDAGPGAGRTEITTINADGKVRIETASQVITGDAAIYDVKADQLTVTGAVTVTQGSSVVKGTKLFADLRKKTSQMTGGRVSGSFVPSQTGGTAKAK